MMRVSATHPPHPTLSPLKGREGYLGLTGRGA